MATPIPNSHASFSLHELVQLFGAPLGDARPDTTELTSMRTRLTNDVSTCREELKTEKAEKVAVEAEKTKLGEEHAAEKTKLEPMIEDYKGIKAVTDRYVALQETRCLAGPSYSDTIPSQTYATDDSDDEEWSDDDEDEDSWDDEDEWDDEDASEDDNF